VVLLTNLWMGFLYMFIVCTDALQLIPADVEEAIKRNGSPTGGSPYRPAVHTQADYRHDFPAGPHGRDLRVHPGFDLPD
jgi:permease component of ABC-type sugar transporter